MATSTERFGFTKPAGSDPASVVPLNSNTDLIELYLGRTQDSIAPMYDDTETYSVGDLRTYESRLYKCNTDISTPETFDPEKWDLTTAVQEGGGGGSGASAIEKTQAEYDALTPAQKTNGAIYMVQDDGGVGNYEYHTNQAETIVVRVNKTTNEIEWFFVDYTFTGGSVEQIPSELVAYLPASTISGNAYDTSLQTMMGYVAINAQGGFGLYPTDYSREIAGTVKCLLKNTDGTEQANTYTDPYEGTGDAVNRIYYMGTEYANTNGGSGGGGGSSEAGDINYDNTTSQLTADNVQDAIDEVVANVETASEDILTLQNVQGYDEYDETQTYAVGDYAIYNNHVYECTTAVSTAEPFDASKWSETSIEQIIDGVKGDVSQLNSSLMNIQSILPQVGTGTASITINAGQHMNTDVPITIPSGKSVRFATVLYTPNASYVFGQVVTVSNTRIVVGLYNTATSSVSGNVTVQYLYY